MQFFEIAQRAKTFQIGRVSVHTNPIESFNLSGVTWQLGNIGEVTRLPENADASTHGKRPFRNRPLGSVRTQSVEDEKQNENAAHESVPLKRTCDTRRSVLQTLNAEGSQFVHGLRRQLCSREEKLLQRFQRKQHRDSGIVQLTREP